MNRLGPIEYESINAYGPLVALPAASGRYEVASHRLSSGRCAVLSVRQGLQLDPANTVLPVRVPGVKWRLYLRDAANLNRVTIPLRPDGDDGDLPWTFADGRSIAKGLFVKDKSPLSVIGLEVQVDLATIPVTVKGFVASLIGFEFNEANQEQPGLLQLLAMLP